MSNHPFVMVLPIAKTAPEHQGAQDQGQFEIAGLVQITPSRVLYANTDDSANRTTIIAVIGKRPC